MKTRKLLLVSASFVFLFLLGVSIEKVETPLHIETPATETIKTSGAGNSLDMWSFERAYPFENIPVSKFQEAFEQNKRNMALRSNLIPGEWESLGPKNIGGRTLCLAFHPTDEDIIYAGSASGGLWKTTTQGVGEDAWEYVPTGFPLLGVASIAIDKNDPDIMLLGTGEVYGAGLAEPGTVVRLTRGTYGIGILKTIDGGNTWSHVLDFNNNEIKGVQDIAINEQNSQEIYAATTDGVYKSTDGGDNWALIFSEQNCIDIEIDPTNGDIIYVSQGNFNNGLDPNLSGIFKSTNGGNSFTELLDPGLITAWSGSAKLEIDPSNSNIIYASIQVGWFNTGPTTPAGIFKSSNGGINWTRINNQNIALYQGWYSHDIAVNPLNPNEIINVGINAWKSTDTGANFIQKTANTWTMGEVLVTVPEGGNNYVHSDIHAVYYHPINNKVFMASDGGVFVSDDGEVPYTTLNGGLKTTQFYADMSSSAQNPNFCIGGTQDNASYIYKGNPSWWRVIGGDGMSASVHQSNDQIVFGSSQGLNILKSLNNGASFFNIGPNLLSGDYTAFSAPYKLAPSNQDIMYAAGTYLYKSTDVGANWAATGNQSVDGGNVIIKIEISPLNPDIVYVATAGDPFGTWGSNPKLFKSINGGQSFTLLTGLPDRLCKDIEVDPNDDNVVYAVFSGFGSDHVYKSIDASSNWTAIDGILPDVPTNTIAIDPLNSDNLYVGNDLGVYFSENGGNSWEIFSDALPEATMIYDLNVSPSNRKLRIATHGHGIWQRDFVNDPLGVDEFTLDSSIRIYPNPSTAKVNLDVNFENAYSSATIELYSVLGQKVADIYSGGINVGTNNFSFDVSKLKAGVYFVTLRTNDHSASKQLIVK